MQKYTGKNREEEERIKRKQDIAASMWQQGYPLEQIEEATGYKRGSILDLMKKLGIKEPDKKQEPEPIYRAVDKRRLRRESVHGKTYIDVADYIGGR